MSPLPSDPYKTLGVDRTADSSAIRTAYRKLVLKCHPDKIQDPALKALKQDEFQRVQQAYEILSDDKKRSKYDKNFIRHMDPPAPARRSTSNSRREANVQTATSRASEPPPNYSTSYAHSDHTEYVSQTHQYSDSFRYSSWQPTEKSSYEQPRRKKEAHHNERRPRESHRNDDKNERSKREAAHQDRQVRSSGGTRRTPAKPSSRSNPDATRRARSVSRSNTDTTGCIITENNNKEVAVDIKYNTQYNTASSYINKGRGIYQDGNTNVTSPPRDPSSVRTATGFDSRTPAVPVVPDRHSRKSGRRHQEPHHYSHNSPPMGYASMPLHEYGNSLPIRTNSMPIRTTTSTNHWDDYPAARGQPFDDAPEPYRWSHVHENKPFSKKDVRYSNVPRVGVR